MTLDERLQRYLDATPRIHPEVFIAEGARILGSVEIHENASIWYNAVLRADIQSILIGRCSNIQDNCTVHLDNEHGVVVGEYVTVGHMAMLHACTIGNETLIGMQATILDGAKIGSRCIIGANALVTMNMEIPDGSMAVGSPAKVVRTLDLDAQKKLKGWAEKYVAVSRAYLARGLGTPLGRFQHGKLIS